MNLFDKISIQNVGDIDFNVIFDAENSIKFQKTKFWKENLVEDVVTFGPMAHATLVKMKSKGNQIFVISRSNPKKIGDFYHSVGACSHKAF